DPHLSCDPQFQLYDLFFFSSRRRHTSFSRDWSSDVCSSDLERMSETRPAGMCKDCRVEPAAVRDDGTLASRCQACAADRAERAQIGRASCRERVQNSEVSDPRTRHTHGMTRHTPTEWLPVLH